MKAHLLSIIFGLFVFAHFVDMQIKAQAVQRIGESLNTDNSSLITSGLREWRQQRPLTAAEAAVVKFKPSGDSGVAKALADVLGSNTERKAALTEAFQQIKQGYEAGIAKEGKSNNLAAAFTFFIAVNVMAFTQTEEPSEQASETLFANLQAGIANLPEFARMSNLEKQKMHDWLACMGGLVMNGYQSAKQTGDKNTLANYRELARHSLQVALGIEADKLSFKGDKLSIAVESTVAPVPRATDNKIIGIWSKSSASPWGTAPGTVLTNAGYYKGQYQFKGDGSYTFKGESWGGPMRSEEFWTITENGDYAVNGNTLTITPRASVATRRNAAGTVLKTQNNALTAASYRWRLHYFEGIGETNLVLQPTAPVPRDGGFAGNSAFSNSYLYSQGGKLEWRF